DVYKRQAYHCARTTQSQLADNKLSEFFGAPDSKGRLDTRVQVRKLAPAIIPAQLEMEPWRLFHFCPRCGRRRKAAPKAPLFHCGACGFHYHFNPTLAVAVIVVREDGRVLFIRRARSPGKGKLGMPGGFVDFGESAEEAARRETREEVGIELDDMRFLGSYVNRYPYKGLTYVTLDLFFVARSRSRRARALEDVQTVCWLKPAEVRTSELAFVSMRKAWKRWARGSRGSGQMRRGQLQGT
ncbi:MAG: NUDIX domain-containing protein, partial [Verrucomicrobiae bacterium]|nr:NUDIX domain-containing protein [Verrucomicrobiae bacterium]